jgi:hypothetical protein
MEPDSVARATLARYDETLLRAVAARLFKPRSQWPVDELVARAAETLTNTPVVDRRLKDLPPSCRALLAAVGLARRNEWPVGQLLELLATLGHAEGLAPILTLLDSGLALPVLPETISQLRNWETWLGSAPASARLVFPPIVAERAIREGTGLPQLPGKRFDTRSIHTADGLEWPLRLGVLWQQLRAAPVRLTQANALFKRDQLRLQADPLLAAPVADQLVELPDAGVLVMGMGIAIGLFVPDSGELRAGPFPPSWDAGQVPTIADFWAGTSAILHWDPLRGYFLSETGEPFPTVAISALLHLAVQIEGTWTHPADIAERIHRLHPSWAAALGDGDPEAWMEAMLLGWALPAGLVEAAQDGEGWWVRLTNVGRHLLAGAPAPDLTNPLSRCLVVQPNADVIAYRQGLTPGLIARLSRFAEWKMIGPACTLGLSAESVYRGLESGLALPDIVSVLQQHSAHPVPANVLDLIRRWAGKRERITVHTSATLLEFNAPAELDAAVERGLVYQKLTDRIGIANGELDYKHFRLLGNRDYEAKPQKCIAFDRDGVTFSVDVAAADLLLEAELPRLAEPISEQGPERRYRITPATARRVHEHGFLLSDLEQWSLNRAGEPLPASARLLFTGGGSTGELRRRLVLAFPSEEITDGVCQWPDTADLLDDRLGPYTVSVPEENVEELVKRLAATGIETRRE